ncbi:MAG: bifunctional cytidylyltransferase/SDR family oxidoreductase [Paludibacter sp.]|nr:bifunctional cytidylyltransferase/SDR family oxidoreductase [Bacteroidales bacterium]MCM1069882.1 bifunctional cytidylyltransferase/SDR family oxidoreductase [Prevotella sp.]MCM1354563.1 bifunctional cytidylyltransferase/SDR family oxidoreductase [Bacteroides sp.]MCM1443458.1 bifunctional cytidylyltransferase/SDR family oxidoreductase [Muribaculum sp.]MCM1482542.1 bifunctional cytidylyltransferase/SDR family oxidoreductase [Paludibacter sp.]
MRNIAIILAGGSGTRLGNDIPKQFLKIAGKQVIEHTIDVFERCDAIDEICIVSRPDFVGEIETLKVRNRYRKVRKILQGGKERYESSLAAINAYTDDADNLLFHDAVRPLVNERIINGCINALKHYNAVDVATPTTDTIVSVNPNDCIDFIPDRRKLRNGQTPQCFKRGTIRQAYQLALADPDFVTTDDCGTVRKYMPEEPIFVVRGENFNMKLTYVEDIFLLDKLFQLRTLQGVQDALTENTLNALRDKVIVVFGGSYGIGGEIVRLAAEQGAHIHSFSRSQTHTDVADAESVRTALQRVAQVEGRIDVVINTAGILVKDTLVDMDETQIHASLNTNLLGVINVARESFRYLQATQGALLFYTSSSYTRGRMLYSLYSATKAAIVNFVQAIAEEWSDCHIRVNCINPERTKTPMRVQNFGNEPEHTLLPVEDVAIVSLNTVFSSATGEVIDVRRRP